jgi:hypothetical protein
MELPVSVPGAVVIGVVTVTVGVGVTVTVTGGGADAGGGEGVGACGGDLAVDVGTVDNVVLDGSPV